MNAFSRLYPRDPIVATRERICGHASGEREGLHPPSSENPFHLSVYKVRPDLQAIIHAHPGALVSFRICGQAPDTRLSPKAWRVCGPVAFAPYALSGGIIQELLGAFCGV